MHAVARYSRFSCQLVHLGRSFSRTSIQRCTIRPQQQRRLLHMTRAACTSTTEPLAPPLADGEPKEISPKIQKIVDDIATLTLLEVSELNALLKKTFNIADTPMMPMGGFAAAPKEEEEEAVVEVKEEQTEFTVKLVKFDDASKVKLIKEIKTFKEGMNLVQAKKFVEATTTGPQVVKEGIAKDEAEAIKAALEPLGAVVQID
ncbi:PREDICTED: 39S ribosomal protein L12, mitochondrial-like [Branchiostoma belcheri]|uniref:Large ribosomal subunit protein bL12m n=1 Tax=Branchiostoma belcheri TaxID=7741 RepID=A0A6P4XYZ6_BRABE|nr:PREDICTED: 39S ribosomal protein L12, mitochondrial-like [Branchiostoma belcheri]